MSVKKDEKNGKWYGEGSVHGERYHRLLEGARNRSEAIDMDNAIRREISLRQKGLLPEKKKRYKLKDGIILWHNASKMNVDYKHDLPMIKIIETFIGVETYLDDISLNKALRFQWYVYKEMPNSRTKQKGHSPATTNRYVAKLRKIMSLSFKEKYIDYNPLPDLGDLEENNERERYLTPDEEERLFQTLADHIKPIVFVELRTGLRMRKVLDLQWKDIDFDSKLIKITKLKKGKPVPKNLHLSKETEEYLLTLPRDSEYIFTNPKTGTAYKTISKGFKEALKRANIKDFRFHDLRHTVASRMLDSGANIRTVQQQLGQTQVTTTERYTHSTSEAQRRAVDSLDSYGKENNEQ